MNSGMSQLGIEEERILASFCQRLIEIAVVACGRETGAFATNVFNRMHLPAIILDRREFVVEMNAAAGAVFDPDINIKDNRLCVRDLKTRALLKVSLDEMTKPVKSKSLIAEPIIVQRHGKLPLIWRILPLQSATAIARAINICSRNAECVDVKPWLSAAILSKFSRRDTSFFMLSQGGE